MGTEERPVLRTSSISRRDARITPTLDFLLRKDVITEDQYRDGVELDEMTSNQLSRWFNPHERGVLVFLVQRSASVRARPTGIRWSWQSTGWRRAGDFHPIATTHVHGPLFTMVDFADAVDADGKSFLARLELQGQVQGIMA